MNRHVVAPSVTVFARLKSIFSGAALGIALLAMLAVFGFSGMALHAESAHTFFKRGQKAEAHEDYDAAFDNYQKAYKKDPQELRYRAAFYRLRDSDAALHVTKGRKLVNSGNEQGALVEFLHAAEIDPSNEAAQQEITKIQQKTGESAPAAEPARPLRDGAQEEIDSIGSPVELRPVSNEPVTLHMQEDAKVVYQAVGKAAGINVLFDPDFAPKRIQVDLSNVSLMDALRIVGTISNTFWRPVTSNTVFVAQNTKAKRTELDEQAVETLYLSNAWQQNDLTDVQTAIRNVLPGSKVYAVASQNAIVIRGTPDELLLAQKLVNDLDKSRPEVVVDIAVLEVSKNWEKNLGITWPTSASIELQTDIDSTSSSSTTTTTATADEATLYNLAHLKSSDFLVTIGAAKLNLLLSDSNTKVLDNPRIRCTDQQKATMKIGKRIPIATGSYQTGTSTSTVSSLVNTQFQYIDVGINIEMTPTIHYDNDVTLKIKLEDSSESGTSTISGVTEPIIAQKTSEQVIRLHEGEASILSGMTNKTDEVDWNGVPGLSAIPGLKYLFGSKDHTITEDEIVFVVIPHVVRSQYLEPVNLRAIDTGSGQSVDLRYSPSERTSRPAPPRPVTRSHPGIGTVSGQSASAAAPAVLAEMLESANANESSAAKTKPAATPKPAGTSFLLTPPAAPLTVGGVFKVPVVLNGGTNISAIPLQIDYDPNKLALLNVDRGDFLSRDGQQIALVHRDDGPGSIKVSASRPPGAAGVSGTGVVCILTFQTKSAGESAIAITHASTVNNAQQQMPAPGARINVKVH